MYPVAPLLHKTFPTNEESITGAEKGTNTESVTRQPFAWVIITEFQPSTKLLLGFVVIPFSHKNVQVLNIH